MQPFLMGEWLVDPETNALSRDGIEQRIEPKVMKVLLTLAAASSHVVSKDKLIATVWPDSFVSDDVLTRCISILRRITGDSAHSPRYIQTVPRVGYRMVASLSELPASLPAPPAPLQSLKLLHPAVAIPELSSPVIAPEWPTVEIRPVRNRRTGMPVWTWFACGMLAFSFLCWRILAGRVEQRPLRFHTLQFTFAAGEQVQPAFSPDGTQVAFVQVPEDGGVRRIFLKKIGSEESIPLNPPDATGGIGDVFSPAWSPDGKQIAYLALTHDGPGLYLAAAHPNGKDQPRRLAKLQEPAHWEQGALSWSPDGRFLIFPDHLGWSPESCVLRLELKTGKVRTLTSPPAGWEGDLTPVYSPDGSRIAFTRASETAVRDLYWIAADGGPLHQLTRDRTDIDSLAWGEDGRSVLFSSNRGGKLALWSIALNAREPERVPDGTEDAVEPAVSRAGSRLAYVEGSAIWSIQRVSLRSGIAVPVFSSTQQDSAPSLSPDGRQFAMQSLRSGSQQIWLGAVDGSSLRQLTSMNGPLTGSPAWSHDGRSILFDSRPDGHSHIFLVGAGGGQPQQLTSGGANDIVPRWSTNDRTVYFRSNRGGRWQLWRVSADGGDPQPVTPGDGMEPQESADGNWLYYTRGDANGIFRFPLAHGGVAQGTEEPVLDQPSANYWGYWQLTPRGIYYLDLQHGHASIRMLDTAKRSVLAPLTPVPPEYAGLSVSADGTEALITEKRDAGRHITLVQEQH